MVSLGSILEPLSEWSRGEDRLHLNTEAEIGSTVLMILVLKRVLHEVLHKARKVMPTFQWRSQEMDDARILGCSLKQVVGIEGSCPTTPKKTCLSV